MSHRMLRLMLWVWIVLLLVPVQARAAQPDATELAAFQQRLDQYTALHHRLEGPLPPLQVSSDLSEVQRLMTVLRSQLQASRKKERRGSLLTSGVVTIIRARIAASITIDEIAETAEAVDEHMPPNKPRRWSVNEALPEDVPFGLIPPQVLRALPVLPPELRWGGALLRARPCGTIMPDLIVDIAPGVFDATTYAKTEKVDTTHDERDCACRRRRGADPLVAARAAESRGLRGPRSRDRRARRSNSSSRASTSCCSTTSCPISMALTVLRELKEPDPDVLVILLTSLRQRRHRGRGDEARRVSLRQQAVQPRRRRGDGRAGARNHPPAPRGPPAARQRGAALRLRAHRRRFGGDGVARQLVAKIAAARRRRCC